MAIISRETTWPIILVNSFIVGVLVLEICINPAESCTRTASVPETTQSFASTTPLATTTTEALETTTVATTTVKATRTTASTSSTTTSSACPPLESLLIDANGVTGRTDLPNGKLIITTGTTFRGADSSSLSTSFITCDCQPTTMTYCYLKLGSNILLGNEVQVFGSAPLATNPIITTAVACSPTGENFLVANGYIPSKSDAPFDQIGCYAFS